MHVRRTRLRRLFPPPSSLPNKWSARKVLTSPRGLSEAAAPLRLVWHVTPDVSDVRCSAPGCARSDGQKCVDLTARKTYLRHGLLPIWFSSHSPRRGGISDMRALWSTASDLEDLGNNILGSKAMAEAYDYAIGIRPLAFESLTGEYQSTVKHLKKLLPAERLEIQRLGHVVDLSRKLRGPSTHEQE